nr:chaperonin-like RbcX protein 2, chloroplastic isoform X2 [Ipomoea batatas]
MPAANSQLFHIQSCDDCSRPASGNEPSTVSMAQWESGRTRKWIKATADCHLITGKTRPCRKSDDNTIAPLWKMDKEMRP